MAKELLGWLQHIILIDNHPLTAELIIRLFAYINNPITRVDAANELIALDKNQQADLILMNLAFPAQNKDESLCMDYVINHIPIIYYTPSVLITDFMHAVPQNKHLIDDSWMCQTQLFRYLNRFSSRSKR